MSIAGARQSASPRSDVRVIGCDPGTRTGLALFHHDELTQVAVPFGEVEDVLRLWLASEVRTTVAIERFVITVNTGKKTQQTDALKVSGIIQNLVERTDHHRLVYQNMSDAKRLCPRELLRALGWWRTGKNATHMNDAAAHVFKVMADHHPMWVHQNVTPDII